MIHFTKSPKASANKKAEIGLRANQSTRIILKTFLRIRPRIKRVFNIFLKLKKYYFWFLTFYLYRIVHSCVHVSGLNSLGMKKSLTLSPDFQCMTNILWLIRVQFCNILFQQIRIALEWSWMDRDSLASIRNRHVLLKSQLGISCRQMALRIKPRIWKFSPVNQFRTILNRFQYPWNCSKHRATKRSHCALCIKNSCVQTITTWKTVIAL